MQRQEEFFDGLALWHQIANEKNAGHGLAGPNALVRKVGDGIAIVSEKDSFFARCPGQDNWIERRLQTGILNANRVHFGQATEKAAQDVAVEILVSRKPNHATIPWPWLGR